ncbi:DUF4296 domain-containing protein [Adhaeribacter soli]|uniref:DUF4296 domain-containing protein n=1 Tax=Adhaeribacter soli TaxID=2607655 RepID=A0A5N1J5M2_9BACT|nr:DUF4296 domain-containing protein [Adhaeribacter soli]KAA9346027.1 DUF4296 domain-containing protein [Adhaeribacter soli]
MKQHFLLFTLLALVSCAEKKPQKPAGLVAPGKLTSILADIHIAESRVEEMRVHPDTAKVVFNRLQKEIFQKQGVTETEFNKTYNYYQDHVAELDKVYEALVDTLGMREVRLNSKAGGAPTPAPEPKPDSLIP